MHNFGNDVHSARLKRPLRHTSVAAHFGPWFMMARIGGNPVGNVEYLRSGSANFSMLASSY